MKRALHILNTLTWIFALHGCAIGAWAARCAAGEQIHSLLNVALRDQVLAGVNIPEVEELNCPLVLTGAESLVLASVRPDPLLHSLEARFKCASAGCLPFVVRINIAEGAQGALAGKKVTRRSKPLLAAMANQHSISAVQSLVRPGETVTLLWEDGRMRITRAMVCLDRGEKDQRVRTRAREGGRIVRARVLSAGMVKAEP
jgi:hypothetical protein